MIYKLAVTFISAKFKNLIFIYLVLAEKFMEFYHDLKEVAYF